MFKRFSLACLATVVIFPCLEMGGRMVAPSGELSLIPPAQAIVGRPLTPVSVAGVARRTVR